MRLPVIVAVSTAAVLVSAPAALAAPAAPTTGQPSQDCEAVFPTGPLSPSGFNTYGFAHATTVYAGSDGTPSLLHGSPVAVSQYDVACYQVSLHH
jgi:hypothetical protein